MTTTDFGAVHNSALELTDRLRKTDAYPLFPVVAQAGPTRARVRAAGCATERDLTVLASAGYLGLAHHPEVRERAADALRRFGTGTYGSQAAGGFTALHEELERTVAAWPDRPAALLFPSGLQADLGVLGTLAGPGGAAELLGVLDRVDVVTGTFSKSFASTGGYACANERVVDLLRHAPLPARGAHRRRAAAARRHGCTLRSRAATGRPADRRSSGRGAVNGE
ncbi:aminotransferase class I/II-fold pyridoxal phosphate-dependent enzyme [Streptomyces nondiastaticus]|uniref:8-amino-7-oxononanoate synthase n=1 Tax=Streptomyces nondiastaticus TaxID=3154512 RepID=A0ABW6U0T5_9ACTN